MAHPIQHLIDDSRENVVMAYDEGFKDGVNHQDKIYASVIDPKKMLVEFVSFMKGFKLVKLDDEKLFSNGEHLVTDESIVSNFLLRTGYNEKD